MHLFTDHSRAGTEYEAAKCLGIAFDKDTVSRSELADLVEQVCSRLCRKANSCSFYLWQATLQAFALLRV